MILVMELAYNMGSTAIARFIKFGITTSLVVAFRKVLFDTSSIEELEVFEVMVATSTVVPMLDETQALVVDAKLLLI